jgi:hypothetical protein
MIECPFCHTLHVENTLLCAECGTYLLESDEHETDPVVSVESGKRGFASEDFISPDPNHGTGPLIVRLRIENGQREVEVPLNRAIHLGRLDPASDTFPEIDLTDLDGLEKGVSRRHARILKRDGLLVVEDLGSINGTFVNGQKLAPYLAEVLHHGDTLRLGMLTIEINLG